jgi:hypothetical protein
MMCAPSAAMNTSIAGIGVKSLMVVLPRASPNYFTGKAFRAKGARAGRTAACKPLWTISNSAYNG